MGVGFLFFNVIKVRKEVVVICLMFVNKFLVIILIKIIMEFFFVIIMNVLYEIKFFLVIGLIKLMWLMEVVIYVFWECLVVEREVVMFMLVIIFFLKRVWWLFRLFGKMCCDLIICEML